MQLKGEVCNQPSGEKHRDYAGAQAKSDAREIKLVRKLDARIMVSPLLFLEFIESQLVNFTFEAHPVVHVFLELHRPRSFGASPTQ
jgi:hypothetical protein